MWERITLEPVFGWGAAAALAAVLLLSLWLTATVPGVSRRGRSVLLVLRLIAAWLLFLGWLRPGVVSTVERETEGAIAVLMDQSQSMILPSGESDASRWEVQRDVWQSIVAATDLKIGQSTILPFAFDAQLHQVDPSDLPELEALFQRQPGGRRTDAGRALADLQQAQVDPPLRGTILMTDGVQTVIPPEVDAAVVARQMAQLDQPVVVIGVGPQPDKSQLRDVAIEGLPEHYTAFVKKELGVRFVLAAQGVQNQPIDVQLKLKASGEPDRVVGTRKVLASRPKEKLPLDFTVLLPNQGEYLLEVTARIESPEQIESNNQALSFITVREGGARILYLEGEPRAEQLFLKRSLNESLDFDVEYVLFPDRDRRTGKWPVRLGDSIQIDQYDAIVLGDLDSSAVDTNGWQTIANRVRRGVGLMATGGYHAFDAGGYGRTPLAPVFPVALSRRRQPFDQPIDPTFHIEGDIRLIPRRPHPVTTLAKEPENSRIWRSLKPLQGMNRLGRVLPNPGVQVLLESQEGDPALVAGQFGQGRVLAFAGDTTWQWWLAGQRKVHQQFWRQAMLWLIRRDLLNEGFRLSLERRRWQIDDTPHLTIEWFGGSESKPMPKDLRIELSRNGQFVQRLSAAPIGEDKLEAIVTGLDQEGLYQVSLTANGDAGHTYASEVAFLVQDTSRELERPDADWQWMANLVAANQSAGGRLLRPDQIAEAVDLFRNRQEATRVEVVEKRRLGDAAWDAWLYLALFSAVMTLEWGLRKRWQLP